MGRRLALLALLPFSYSCVSDDSASPQIDSGAFYEDAGGFDATVTPGPDAMPPGNDATTSAGTDATTEAGTGDDGGQRIADAAVDALGDSSAPTDSGAGSDDVQAVDAALANACAEFAEGICGDLSICSANELPLPALYGDLPTCEVRIQSNCMTGFGATGSTQTVAQIEACGEALNNVTVTCAQFRSGAYGGACTLSPGTVATGGPCAFDNQCQSSFCAIPPNEVCGTCQPPTTAGGSCVSGDCSAGQVCYQPTSACIAVESVANYGACQVVTQCDYIRLSTACDMEAGTCTLTERTAYPADAGCGRQAPGSATIGTEVILCPGSGSCSAATFPGSCSPAAPDNGACTYDGGLNCMPPAVCVSGVCKLLNAAACP
jgi:hypothetical protein